MPYDFIIDAKRERELARRLGAAIAQRREKVGLTQEQVSEMLGIGNQAVSRMERGAVMPTMKRVFEFSGLFQCGADELILAASDREADQAAVIASVIANVPPRKRDAFMAIVKQLAELLGGRPVDERPKGG